MIYNTAIQELIDRYLADIMPAEEREAFEKRLDEDAALADEVEKQRELIDSLKLYYQREAVKARLNRIHEEGVQGSGKHGRLYKKRSLWWPAAAALLTLLIVSGGLFFYMNELEKKREKSYTSLRRDIDRIEKSKVAVENDTDELPESFGGTGIAVSSEGYIVTSYHVVKNASAIIVENSFHRYRAEEIFSDRAHDIAVLKIVDTAFSELEGFVPLLKAEAVDLGEPVFTLGYPRDELVYGEGSVSALTGFEGDSSAYQISVPVNPGNSGGPLLDSQGNLIGLISGKDTKEDGAAFAVKAGFIRELIDSAVVRGSFDKPITLQNDNRLSRLSRTDQLKKLESFVFYIKTYE